MQKGTRKKNESSKRMDAAQWSSASHKKEENGVYKQASKRSKQIKELLMQFQ